MDYKLILPVTLPCVKNLKVIAIKFCLIPLLKSQFPTMKKMFNELEWIFDYYFAYFLYNSNKIHEYHSFMKTKWGSKYMSHTEGI